LNIITKLRASSFDTSYFTKTESQTYFTGCRFFCTQGLAAKIPVPIQFRENYQVHVRCLGCYAFPLPHHLQFISAVLECCAVSATIHFRAAIFPVSARHIVSDLGFFLQKQYAPSSPAGDFQVEGTYWELPRY
jgi:hypothetical protein